MWWARTKPASGHRQTSNRKCFVYCTTCQFYWECKVLVNADELSLHQKHSLVPTVTSWWLSTWKIVIEEHFTSLRIERRIKPRICDYIQNDMMAMPIFLARAHWPVECKLAHIVYHFHQQLDVTHCEWRLTMQKCFMFDGDCSESICRIKCFKIKQADFNS